jgi:hypothetical protein
MPVSRALFYTSLTALTKRSSGKTKSHPSLKVPGKGAPIHVPPAGPLGREMLHFQSQWFIHSFIYLRVPSEGALPRNRGETYGHHPQSPRWMEGLHTIRCGLVPQGDCLQHCYYYPSAMQPSAQYLPPWLGQTRAPLGSACHNNPLQDVPVTCFRLPRDRGYRSPHNPERTRGWIYRRQNGGKVNVSCWAAVSMSKYKNSDIYFQLNCRVFNLFKSVPISPI